MAAVRIYRDPLCGDLATEVPREQWPMLMRRVGTRPRRRHHDAARGLAIAVPDLWRAVP
jgi:hypothetical protein